MPLPLPPLPPLPPHACHRWLHEYQLTPHSLYAAVSIGLETGTILAVLGRLAKNALPREVAHFVRECTQNYGKVCAALCNALLCPAAWRLWWGGSECWHGQRACKSVGPALACG